MEQENQLFFLCLNGVLKPDSGEYFFNDEKVKYDTKGIRKLRKNVGIVFQEPDNQLFSANMYQEIAFGPLNLKLSQSEVKKRVDDAMEEMDLVHLKKKPTHFLSYGQKKRVTIADILAMEPDVIIFDEPTACLDPKQTEKMNRKFDQLCEKGITVLISTHDINSAYHWADHVILLKEGGIYGEGNAEDIFSDELLLNGIGIEKPLIIDIFEELKKNEKISKEYKVPRTREDLKKMIRG